MKEFVITEVDMMHLHDASVICASLLGDKAVWDAVTRLVEVMDDAGKAIANGDDVLVRVQMQEDREAPILYGGLAASVVTKALDKLKGRSELIG